MLTKHNESVLSIQDTYAFRWLSIGVLALGIGSLGRAHSVTAVRQRHQAGADGSGLLARQKI